MLRGTISLLSDSIFSVAQQRNLGLGRLIVEVSRSHTIGLTRTHAVDLFWTIDKMVADIDNYKNGKTNWQVSMISAGIRTGYVRNHAATDLRLKLHDHLNRLQYVQ